jgi:hypothetical protein
METARSPFSPLDFHPSSLCYSPRPMHYDAHQPVIDDLEARIVTLRDSL